MWRLALVKIPLSLGSRPVQVIRVAARVLVHDSRPDADSPFVGRCPVGHETSSQTARAALATRLWRSARCLRDVAGVRGPAPGSPRPCPHRPAHASRWLYGSKAQEYRVNRAEDSADVL